VLASALEAEQPAIVEGEGVLKGLGRGAHPASRSRQAFPGQLAKAVLPPGVAQMPACACTSWSTP